MRPNRATDRTGFSLVELLIVIALLGVLAGSLLSTLNPTVHEQLQGAAQVVAADLSYVRSLAVTHNTTYRVTFDAADDEYTLSHTGADSRFHVLPPSPFHESVTAGTTQVVSIDSFPSIGSLVDLRGAVVKGASTTRATYVEFGPLGETTAADETIIWLSAGSGADTLYIPITVNPVTGLVTIGAVQSTAPTIPSS